MSAFPLTTFHQEIATAVIQFARANPAGFDQSQALGYLEKSHNLTVTIQDLAVGISSLTSSGRLLAFQVGNKYRWKLEDEARFTKLQGLSSMDRIIYQAIETAGNQGVWSRDLRRRTNSQGSTDFDKSIRLLMSRGLIKLEDSIAAKNKKVYMLAELTPAVEVSGTIWYTAKTKDIDVSFIENLKQAALLIFTKKGACTPEQIHQRLIEKQTIRKDIQGQLSPTDLETLCETMVHDGLLEYGTYHDIADITQRKKYYQQYILPMQDGSIDADDLERPVPIYRRPTVPDIESIDLNAFSSPCLSCPLTDVCGSGNVIEPETCEYFTQWIDQNAAATIETPKDWMAQWDRPRGEQLPPLAANSSLSAASSSSFPNPSTSTSTSSTMVPTTVPSPFGPH